MIENTKTNFPASEISITYAVIETEYLERTRADGASKQEIKNTRSALKSWRSTFNLSADAPAGSELAERFKMMLSAYIDKQKQLKKEKSTYAPRASRIRKFRAFYISRQKDKPLPPVFGDRLKYLLERKGISALKFVVTHLKGKLTYGSFRKWITNRCLPFRNFSLVSEIEVLLGAAPDTLVSLLPARSVDITHMERTSFGKKIQKAGKKKYGVWTESLERELQELTKYKSSVIPCSENKSLWTSRSNNYVPAAELFKNNLILFFGYCHLPENDDDPQMSGLGIPKQRLSLALLTDTSITDSYLTVFKKNRAGGKFNNGFTSFISFVTSLLREKTGFLYQRPKMAKIIGLKLSTDEWRKRCVKTLNHLLKLDKAIELARKSGSSEFALGRDPQEPIREILRLKQPLAATFKLTARILADVEKIPKRKTQRAILFRDALIIALLQANPLRARMICEMRINVNLFKRNDGSWWLRFNRGDFKNRLALKEDYEVRLATSLYPLIERYLAEFRPQLVGKNPSDLLFVVSNAYKSIDEKDVEITQSRVSTMVSRRTRQYLLNSPGFRTHAFRHIVSTSIIKENPGSGFYLAASVLNDHPRTVEETYAHIKTSEMFEPYNQIFDENWSKMGGTSDEQ